MNAAAWRVGALALAGIVLLGLAIAAVGGQWFSPRDRAVMRFERSVYGLNTGAPVVLRGVRVGQVTAVGLAPAGAGGLAMPVTAEFDRAMLRDLLGADAPADGPALPVLVQRGLVARLATQSLLTGLLYVDLDLVPGRSTVAAQVGAQTANALPAIPTEATRLQTLQAQLEGLDLAQIGRDLAAVAGSARLLLTGPQAGQLLQRSADAAGELQQLAQALRQQLPPLARSAETTLADTRRTLAVLAPAVAQATGQLGAAAQQVGAAASQAQALALAGQPMVAEVRQAAQALGQAATVLREAAADDSALRLNADRALQDVARAARTLRELGELLERQPDALLRGRPAEP
jgi:paraquat-inducible protein B